MNKSGKILIISGFSGVGKGAIVKSLLKDNSNYYLSVSATTRSPRKNEIDGKDYFFISKEEFKKLILDNKFIEYTSYLDNYYGTLKESISRQTSKGKNVILEIEMEGAEKVKKQNSDIILIFILPPSLKELIRRLNNRNTESKKNIVDRIFKAKSEIQYIKNYDYVIVNENIEKSVEIIKNIENNIENKCENMTDIINKIKNELGTYKGE